MVKKIITIIAIIIIVVIIPIFIVYSCSPASLMKYVNAYPISEINIVWEGDPTGPTVVKMTGQDDIKLILEKLDIKSWNIESIWGNKCSPNLWIRINKDLLIGLYGSGEPYADVETQGGNTKNYRVPPNMYDEIKDSLNKYENLYLPDNLILYTNGEKVSLVDFNVRLEAVRNNMIKMKETVMSTTAPDEAKNSIQIQLSLMEKYPQEAIALADAIEQAGAFSEAKKLNISPSLDETKAIALDTKKKLKEIDPGQASKLEKLFGGQDNYWNIVLPLQLQKQLSFERLKAKVAPGSDAEWAKYLMDNIKQWPIVFENNNYKQYLHYVIKYTQAYYEMKQSAVTEHEEVNER